MTCCRGEGCLYGSMLGLSILRLNASYAKLVYENNKRAALSSSKLINSRKKGVLTRPREKDREGEAHLFFILLKHFNSEFTL